MEPIANLLLIIIGSFLGVTLSIFLLTVKSGKNKANIFLGTYVLLISSYLIQGLFYRTGWMLSMPHIVHTQFLFETGAGALIYLYVRACTEKNFEMKPILWLHFIPVLFSLVYYFPLLMQSGEEKIKFYYEFIFEFSNKMPPIFAVTNSLLALTYLILSFRLIRQYKKHLSNEASSIDYSYHRWLLLFSSSALLPIVGIITWLIIGANDTLRLITISFIFIFIFSVYIFVLLKPEIFHTFPNQILVKEEDEVERQKYESSNLKDSKKEKLIETLVAYMESKKPYKKSDLTLSALAKQVDIPSHYLSQIINEKMKCTFLDFVNGYRVEEAKKMLGDEAYTNYTIVAMAYEAGFNSKTAFYSAFKKHVGMTPSAFRKEMKMV